MASSGDQEAVVARGGGEGGGGEEGSNTTTSAELPHEERGDRSTGFGGNRWPRQETLALLKIRSDMDASFRDASAKGPLWEEVSRKLEELGYHRSAKKCKEKFENVYKYHKRTKDGRISSGKHDKKTYRFFDQLEALDHQTPTHPLPPFLAPPPQPKMAVSTAAAAMTTSTTHHFTVPSTAAAAAHHHHSTMPLHQFNVSPPSSAATNPTPVAVPSLGASPADPSSQSRAGAPSSTTLPNADLTLSEDNSPPSSSSTSSDQGLLEERRRGRGHHGIRKRKWKGFFERLMKEAMGRQEVMQKKFLEAIEKREQERMAREEAWRMQEIARINREREILVQERSAAAAKDAAVMSFLQKIAEQHNLGQAQSNPPPAAPVTKTAPPQPSQPPAQPPNPIPQAVSVPAMTSSEIIRYTQLAQTTAMSMEIHRSTNNGENPAPPSSSRWPKVEVEALIRLRTNLESKYLENGPKGPLWEEISAAMRKLGYNRSAKRCKEKWENINKYFKKVKESNKQRPEDSKTCPYFHQLDALYKEKNYRFEISANQAKPESSMAPLMVTPEQQWPPPPSPPLERRPDSVMEDLDSEHGQDEEEEDEEDDDEEGTEYEIVPSNKSSSVGANE